MALRCLLLRTPMIANDVIGIYFYINDHPKLSLVLEEGCKIISRVTWVCVELRKVSVVFFIYQFFFADFALLQSSLLYFVQVREALKHFLYEIYHIITFIILLPLDISKKCGVLQKIWLFHWIQHREIRWKQKNKFKFVD